MAKSISSTILAKPNFVAGINNKLIAVDVYKKNNTSIVNKIQDISKLFDVDLSNVLKGGKYIESAFPIIKSVSGNLIEINKDNLIGRMAGLSKGIGGSIKELGGGFVDKIKNVEILNQVYTKIDGISTQVRGTSYDGLSSVSELISNVTGDPKLFTVQDKDATTALYTGLIREASSRGIPNSFKAVVGKIEDPVILNSVISNILPDTIKTSDVRMLRSIVGSDNTNVTRLLDPGLIGKFAKGYEFGKGFEENQQDTEFAMMLESFEVIDGKWSRKEVKETNLETLIADATKVSSSSTDFKEGLLNHIKINENLPLEDKLLSLGTVYNQDDVNMSLSYIFPFNVTNNLSANSPNPKTPQI